MTLKVTEADREAGTDGPWIASNNSYGVSFVNGGELHDNRRVKYRDLVCGGNDHDTLSDEDARRIARLPVLEAAYIEAVETLRVIAAEAYVAVDEGYPGTWRNVAVERIDIARAFLERNTCI